MADVTDITSRLVKSARDLDVFKKAYAVSLEIHKASLEFPQIEQYDLAKQVRRASKSVCANLAEGFVKQSHSKAEFKRFISIAIGSASEMQIWLCYCVDLGYIDTKTFNNWNNEYEIIIRMLQNLRSKIKI